ncbi:hypothetical protein CC78DRAFT_577623 [Lojkania enalia]|uniref:Uncharacterized protein n=1 Tax=Lojkania enalia TaxID=147567 RepID=A0A9P4N7Q7_9PLEO|nr:hypothetical protein CC78DRAFT_577623 [Didymosphaeria enalia]
MAARATGVKSSDWVWLDECQRWYRYDRTTKTAIWGSQEREHGPDFSIDSTEECKSNAPTSRQDSSFARHYAFTPYKQAADIYGFQSLELCHLHMYNIVFLTILAAETDDCALPSLPCHVARKANQRISPLPRLMYFDHTPGETPTPADQLSTLRPRNEIVQNSTAADEGYRITDSRIYEIRVRDSPFVKSSFRIEGDDGEDEGVADDDGSEDGEFVKAILMMNEQEDTFRGNVAEDIGKSSRILSFQMRSSNRTNGKSRTATGTEVANTLFGGISAATGVISSTVAVVALWIMKRTSPAESKQKIGPNELEP